MIVFFRTLVCLGQDNAWTLFCPGHDNVWNWYTGDNPWTLIYLGHDNVWILVLLRSWQSSDSVMEGPKNISIIVCHVLDNVRILVSSGNV